MVRKGNQASLLTGIVLLPSPPDGFFLVHDFRRSSFHKARITQLGRGFGDFPGYFVQFPAQAFLFRFHVNKAFQRQEEFPKRREGCRRSFGRGVGRVPDDGFSVRQNGQTGEKVLGNVVGSFQDEADVFIVGKVVFRFQVAGLVGRFIKSRGLGIRQGDATFIKSRQKVFGRGEGVRMSGRPPLPSAKPREAQSSSVI